MADPENCSGGGDVATQVCTFSAQERRMEIEDPRRAKMTLFMNSTKGGIATSIIPAPSRSATALGPSQMYSPCMRDANDMIGIRQGELKNLVCQNGAGISKPKQGMVCEHCPQAHCTGMEHGFMG